MQSPNDPDPNSTKTNPLIELAVTIIMPSVVMMNFSSKERLGPIGALFLGLAFPLGWGIWEAWRKRKLNWLAVLGVVSTLLTGGIGLLELDAKWFAVKEASVPALIGLAILASIWTRKPLIHLLVFNEAVFDVKRVNEGLASNGTGPVFEQLLRKATALLSGTFFFSAIANYLLSLWVVKSSAGSETFNQELGRLTLLSYPAIVIPSMLMMMGLFFWLANRAKVLTGLNLGEMLQSG